MEVAYEDFDDVEFFVAHLTPTTSPSFNKWPIDLNYDTINDEHTTLCYTMVL